MTEENKTEDQEVTHEIVTADVPPAPFDLADLAERLKVAGLPVAEEAARAVMDTLFNWIEDGVRHTETKVDDFALAMLPPLRNFIDQKLQNISE